MSRKGLSCMPMLDTRREGKDGTYPVRISVGNKTQMYLSTGISVKKEQFNEDRGTIVKHPSASAYNTMLKSTCLRTDLRIMDLKNQGVWNELVADKTRLRKLLEDTEAPIEEKKVECLHKWITKVQDESVAKNTKIGYQRLERKLRLYIGDKKYESVTMEEIDTEWILELEVWLKKQKLAVNTIWTVMKNFRKVFNRCIDANEDIRYPFRRIRLKTEKTRKRSLTINQMRDIIRCRETGWRENARKTFLFSFCMIGMNPKDMCNPENRIQDGMSESGRLDYRRMKTGKLYSIKIQPEMEALIESMDGKKGNLTPFVNGDTLCAQVGKWGKFHGNISIYWARHTWATIAASLDIPKETISAALGHEIGSSTTSIYIDFDQRKVDDANRKVLDHVFGIDGIEYLR